MLCSFYGGRNQTFQKVQPLSCHPKKISSQKMFRANVRRDTELFLSAVVFSLNSPVNAILLLNHELKVSRVYFYVGVIIFSNPVFEFISFAT